MTDTSTTSLRAHEHWVPRLALSVLEPGGQTHDYGLTVEAAIDRTEDLDPDSYVTVSFTGTPDHVATALARLLGEPA